MTFEALECFAEIARGSTFIEVAEDFNLSQSALSKIIKKTENELGVELFDRSGRSVKLTEAGRQLLSDYEQMEPSYQALKIHMRQMADGYTLKIVIGIPGGEYHIHNILERFLADNPQIPLNVDMPHKERIQHASKAAQDDDADLIIMHKSSAYHGPSYVTLVPDDPLLAILPKNHRLCAEKDLSLEDIKEEQFIVNNWGQEILWGLINDYQVRFPHVTELDLNREDILWNIIAGRGITVLHQSDIVNINISRMATRKIRGLSRIPLIMLIGSKCPASEQCGILKDYLTDAIRAEASNFQSA